MMKHLSISLWGLICVCFAIQSRAQTVLGGNITWECLGGGQYNVALNLYVDCYGLAGNNSAFPAQVDIQFFPAASCSGVGYSAFSVSADSTTMVEISDLCPTEIPNSSCNNLASSNLGIKKITYESDVALASGCLWTAAFNSLDWSYYFENTDVIFLQDAYISSDINSSATSCGLIDFLPDSNNDFITYFCAGVADQHDVEMTLPAGVTATYDFGFPFTSGSGNTTLAVPGFTIPAGMTINSTTGVVSWNPPALPANSPTVVYLIPVDVTLNSGGTSVGIIRYNIPFALRDCSLTDTAFDPVPVTSTGAETTYTNSPGNTPDVVSVCAGNLLSFTVQASNVNLSRNITITSQFNPAAPALSAITMTQTSLAPGIVTFELQTTAAMASATPYTLELHAVDDACPVPDDDDITLQISVVPNLTIISAPEVICVGDVYTLQAEGAGASNQYTWSVLPGGDATPALTQNIASQNVSPDSTTTYRVSTPLATTGCQSEDFVTVDVSLHRLQLDVIDESCGTLGSIDVTALGSNSTNLTYTWVAGAGGSGIVAGSEDQAALQGGPAGVNYTVTVNDVTNGCDISETVSIFETTGPEFTLTPDASTVCQNSNATVEINFTAGQAPFDIWITNPTSGSPDFTDVADPYDYITPITSNTTISVLQVRDANGCISDPAVLPAGVSIVSRPTITSSFDAAGPICVGDPLSLTISHSSPGTYSVVYSIGGVNQPAVSLADNAVVDVPDPTAAGTVAYDVESVSYTNAPTCPSNDAANASINVVTNVRPTATIPNGSTVSACAGNSAILQLTLTGDGPWTIQYTRDGNPQAPLIVPDNPANPNFVYVWALSTAGEYCVTQVSDANCTSTVTNQCADVVINPYPTLTSYTINGVDAAVGIVDVCENDNIDIEVEISPVGNNYSLNFIGTPDIGVGNYTNQSQSFVETIVGTTNFSLELDKIFFTSAPACFTQVDETIAINIRTEISVAQTDLVCDNVGENYTLEYTISGGSPPLTEEPGGAGGSFAGSVFTTAALPSGGAGGSWTFHDFYNCNSVVMTDAGYSCPIISDGGVMNTAALNICSPASSPSQATATQSTAFTADANDAFMFVLHSNAANVLGSEIARSCGDAVFGDANTPLAFGALSGPGVIVSGTTYFISCVVGNNDGTGCVDETNPNIQFSSNTQSVVWYTAGSATLVAPSGTDACAGNDVPLQVNFTGTGPWTFVYSIDNVNQPSIVVPTQNPYAFDATIGGTYAVESLTNSPQACLGSAAGSVDVVIHPLPTATLSGNATVCAGDTHCFDVTFTGEEPFSIVVNVPNVAANETVNSLLATDQYCADVLGAYQILQVTDAFNCSSNINLNATLAIYPAVTASWLTANESYCPNEPAITASFSTTGDGPFTIDLQGPDPANPPVITNNEITINAPGYYTLASITDIHGCVNTTPDIFEAIELPVPVADAGPDIDQCAGIPSLVGTPLEAGVSYSWTPSAGISPGQSDEAEPTITINNSLNSPYTYTLSVTDGFCSNSDQVVITIHPNPTINLTSTDNILCFDAPNNTATITAAAAGAGVYTYEWSPSTSIVGAANTASIDVDPTVNEIFEVTASEDFGPVSCATVETIAIQVNDPVQIINLLFPPDMCNGTCVNDISEDISFDVLGAFNNAYSATIDGNPATDPICFDAPEDHTLIITDSEGCEAMEDFTINVREQEYVIADTDQDYPFCFSDLDGVVEGNNPEAAQYVLTHNGVNTVVENAPFVFSNLGVGTYDLTVNILLSSGQVCSADTTFTINPDSPEIFISANPPAALGCPNYPITFDADVNGGAGNFITYWNSCPEAIGCQIGTTNESASQELTIILSQDTILYFYALDAIGCSSDTITAIGTTSSNVSLFVQNGIDTLNTCQYDCEELTALATGGTGNLLVEWYELNDVIDLTPTLIASEDTITQCFLFDKIYEIRAIDEQCPLTSVTDTLWVNVHDTPEPIMDADESGSCYPDTIGFYYTLLDTSYSDVSTCTWSLGNGTQLNYCGDTAVVYTMPGTFFPSITITSEFGCVGTDTLSTPIQIRNYPEVDFTWDPQPVDILHRQVHFRNLTAGADSIYWNFYNAGESTAPNPVWTFPDIETTDPYLICLTAGNSYGCLDTLCQEVFIENILQVFIPNTFTPDGDGLNDVFLPIVNGELEGSYRFWVFNRWGDIVFYTEEVGKAWTGGYDGGSYYIQDGYYLWKVEVDSLETGKTETFEGNVFILR